MFCPEIGSLHFSLQSFFFNDFISMHCVYPDSDDSTSGSETFSTGYPSLYQILIGQSSGSFSVHRFGEFLQSRLCYENLAFWLASRHYKVKRETRLFPGKILLKERQGMALTLLTIAMCLFSIGIHPKKKFQSPSRFSPIPDPGPDPAV